LSRYCSRMQPPLPFLPTDSRHTSCPAQVVPGLPRSDASWCIRKWTRPSTAGFLGSVGLSAQMLLPLPDGLSLLGLSPPDVQSVTADVTGTGCQSPRGSLTITSTVGPSFNLGVGSFTPTQFFLSAIGDVAYILGRSTVGSTTAPLPFIISFNIQAGTTSLISLSGNAVPLSAALNRSGNLLVGANDESVHVIDTSTGLDIQQVALTFPQSSLCIAPGNQQHKLRLRPSHSPQHSRVEPARSSLTTL
jgi:hypothetical protein